ncbi:tumor protein p63-regulated gene 1-like protein isoform X1 [Montipora capricornis]|uniref:tumor protein p63-regulated gene 1-like protein isoform X1 n=1 Tax=Montipora capricornis TaxID=246305 RepID=UPI0035F20007
MMSASSSLEAEKDSSRAVSASDMSNVETVAVPTVEVKHAPFQSQPTLRGEVTEEQMKELGERMRTEQAKKYFSLREGAFTSAVEDCKILLDENDGELLSSWLLSEIDHWDHEKERLLLITKKTLCVVKYNFIGVKVHEIKKIPLIHCDKIQIGRFVYPKNSMMMITGYAENGPRSQQSGLRIFFSHHEPSFLQRWNPWSNEIPYISLTSHHQSLLIDSPADNFRHVVFSKALIDAITAARETYQSRELPNSFEVVETDLEIDVYIGLSALIFNQSKLGFYKDRGNVFF